MSSQTLNRRISSKYAGFGAVLTALVAFSLLGMSAGKAQAQAISGTQIAEAQADIDAQIILLKPGKTLFTASPTVLGAAVADAVVKGDTDSSLTPEVYAVAAVTEASGETKLGAGQKSGGPDIVLDLINELVSTSSNGVDVLTSGTIPLSTSVPAITEGVVDAGGTALTLATKEAVVKSALEAVSDAAAGTSGTSILTLDAALGKALVSDTSVEALTITAKNTTALITLLKGSLTGIDGISSKTTKVQLAADVPQAAEEFVDGIVATGEIPDAADGITLGEFAVDLLAPIAKNTTTDELVAAALNSGTSLAYSGTGNLEAEAVALYKAYPSAVSKITQGLLSDVTAQNVTEAGRVAVLTNIAGTSFKDAVAIDEGATYLDPFFSAAFTGAVLTGIPATDAKKDAPSIATGVGNILGQDGAELAAVSGTFADLISGSLGEVGILPASSAGTYAKDLIGAAVKTKIPLFPTTGVAIDGGGGALVLVSGSAYLTDLEAIGDQLALAVVEQSGTATGAKKGATAAAGDIGTLAKDIATFVKQNTSALTDGQFVAEALADSIAETIVEYATVDPNLTTSIPNGKTTETAESLILAAIGSDVESVSTATVKAAIKALFLTGTFTSNPGEVNVGDLTIQETAITNL